MWEPGKPSQNENEYFARRDAEWLKEQRTRLDAERAAKSAEMRCPRCGATLAHRPYRGVSRASSTALRAERTPQSNRELFDASTNLSLVKPPVPEH